MANRICWGPDSAYTDWQSGMWKYPLHFEQDIPEKYQDLDNLPQNQIITYSFKDKVKNYPNNFKAGTVFTYGTGAWKNDGQVQILVDSDAEMAYRVKWGPDGIYTNWNYPNRYQPRPSLALFRSIGIIGDSYASGELAFDDNKYTDHYNMS
ncbi:hypothetical protein, partial [Lactobacillus crispatus]